MKESKIKNWLEKFIQTFDWISEIGPKIIEFKWFINRWNYRWIFHIHCNAFTWRFQVDMSVLIENVKIMINILEFGKKS